MKIDVRRRRKWLWIGAGVVVVALVVLVGGRLLRTGAEERIAEAQTGETVTITRGDLGGSATASGRVIARREVALALATSGRVETVYVAVGDSVEAGAPLVQLEAAALQRAVTSAEQSVTIQQANLEQLRAGPNAADLAAAEAAVSSAQAQLEDLLAGPSDEEVAAGEANLRAAQANVSRASSQLGETQAPADESAILQAQVNMEDAEAAVLEAERSHQRFMDCEQQPDGQWTCVPRDLPFVSAEEEAELIRQAELQVIQARENRNAAQAELQLLQQGADENTVGASQASLAQMAAQRDAAQANLDLLIAGPSDSEIAAARSTLADAEANLATLQGGAGAAAIVQAEAQLAQSEIALQRAQNDLDNTTLVAPFAGVVTAVHVGEGELASGVAVELVDPGSMEVALDVDEVDVGQLEVGQAAVVTLQAWPDEELESEIVSIAPAANSLASNSAIASFRVRLALPETELPVREGMTADATLQTASREDVLLAPNRAIIADRDAGVYYVNVVESGPDGEVVRRVEVSIGLRDDRYTEITAGLAEGDRVRIGSVVEPVDIFDQDGQGGPFGGGP